MRRCRSHSPSPSTHYGPWRKAPRSHRHVRDNRHSVVQYFCRELSGTRRASSRPSVGEFSRLRQPSKMRHIRSFGLDRFVRALDVGSSRLREPRSSIAIIISARHADRTDVRMQGELGSGNISPRESVLEICGETRIGGDWGIVAPLRPARGSSGPREDAR